MRTSHVASLGGVPTLFVDGKALPGVAYITYFTDNNRYADFADAGFRLFSLPVFFAGQTINECSQFPPFMAGIFDNGVHFEVFDKEVRRILDVCPDAMIFPRVNCSLTREWEDAHPDELCDTVRRSCFASDAWAKETERLLTEFIRYVQTSDYADNIIGYQVAGGNTEEWFSFDGKGSVGLRSREKYAMQSGRFYEAEDDYTQDADFYDFLACTTVDRIIQFASLVKRLVNRQQVVGTFYGYTFDCPWGASGHLALGRLLESEHIDFICSPASYMELRAFGIDHPCMLPVDSLKHHGKLYFVENDTRTDLSRPPNDQPHYNQPIWFGPDRATSLEILKQHFCRALLHGHAQWWFDMWGGWYASEDLMAHMRNTRNIAEAALCGSRASAAEVAVFIDEKSMLTYNGKHEAFRFRHALGLMGAAYDCYLVGDFADVCERYRFCIFLEPTKTAAMSEAIASCPCEHLVITKENCTLTASELRSLLAKANVSIRAHADAVVYETEQHIFIGGTDASLCYDGETELLLDGIGRLYRKR